MSFSFDDFDDFDDFDEGPPSAPEPETSRLFRQLKRGDTLSVGRTKWVVESRSDEVTLHAVKHGSKGKKLYLVRSTDRENTRIEVLPVNPGSGAIIGPAVATGELVTA